MSVKVMPIVLCDACPRESVHGFLVRDTDDSETTQLDQKGWSIVKVDGQPNRHVCKECLASGRGIPNQMEAVAS